ncbi:hypothetical protein NVP1121O_120 [Vibrio phage 1.121.O._10N.286.46.C4]|nr:hypothetical protein NVP1121O_120 [Vibrio phage 1.121.O._10N.286.46.C4]
MQTKVIKKTSENHQLVCALYQVSKCELGDRNEYDLEVLDRNGIKHFNAVEYVSFEEDQPLVHSIFIVEMQNDFLPTQLIFTY